MDETLSAERQTRILDELRRAGQVVTSRAAAQLGVSVDTVRRDLVTLEEVGQARRVHGGAVLPSGAGRSFRERVADASGETAALASFIAARFRRGQVVGLDAGSTSVEIARRIPADLELTIVTTGPPVAIALEHHHAATVVLTGGVVDMTWLAATGAEAARTIRSFRFDVAVLGVCAVHPEHGATTTSFAEVETKRAWVDAAAEVVVPVSAEKLDRVAPFVVCALEEISVMAVPAGVAHSTRMRYRRTGVDLVSP
jgi:DeoR/GlpR family transcriptional regulator of sugar metabolism